jgi:hypothetical protein
MHRGSAFRDSWGRKTHDRRSRKILKRDGSHSHSVSVEDRCHHIGVRDLEGSVNYCNGNRDIPICDFPITTGVWAIGARARDKCRKVKPCRGSTSGGIRNRRIGNPKGVSFTHSNSVNSETLIGERTVVSWTSRSHAKGASQRELSQIGNRGSVR